MKGESFIVKQILQKAKDSALLAIEYYNKPAVSFKSEGFIVMMCISWTSLFHAYFRKHEIKPWYNKSGKGKRPRYEYISERLDGKIIKDKKWWDLSKCLKEFFENSPDNAVQKNIEFLSKLRNFIVHRNIPELDATIFGECQSSVLNLNYYLDKHFGVKHKIDTFLSFSIQTFQSPKNFIEASKEELKKKNAIEIVEFIKAFRSTLSTEIWESEQFSFKAVLIKVVNRESRDVLALKFINERDLTEEQRKNIKDIGGIVLFKEKSVDKIPENFSWKYDVLRKNVKEEISFLTKKVFDKFKDLFKLRFKDKFVHERVHNPKSEKSKSTFYYDPKILNEFKKLNPVVVTNTKKMNEIFELVDKIISDKQQDPHADTNEMDQKINEIVYKSHDFIDEEKKL